MAHPAAPQLTIGVDTHLDVHVALQPDAFLTEDRTWARVVPRT